MHTVFLQGNVRESDHLEELRSVGRLILNWIVGK